MKPLMAEQREHIRSNQWGGDAKAKITLKMEVGHDRGYPYD